MSQIDVLDIRGWITSHGGWITAQPYHWLIFFAFTALNVIAIALTAPTPRGKLIRAGIVAPISISYFLWFVLFVRHPDWQQQFGNSAGMIIQTLHTLKDLVFFTAEEHNYRLLPNSDKDNYGKDDVLLYREPVPAPRTWAKLRWAFGLYWSYRGIGWNYAFPLPPDSKQHPYRRSSTRRAFMRGQLMSLIRTYLAYDLSRAWMNCGSASSFFSGRPGLAPSYDSLSQFQRATHSLPVAMRVAFSIVIWQYLVSMICVSIGGLMGWEGEWWSPWGWPPVFGSIGDIWRNPGLGFTWAKMERRWLYLLGWIGLGEKILGLPHSGTSSKPLPPGNSAIPVAAKTSLSIPLKTLSVDTPETSGQTSPAHPLPTTALTTDTMKRSSPKMMLSNLIKSMLVFMLTGLMHDFPIYMTYLHTSPPGRQLDWSEMSFTMPFFLMQPLGIAVEAFVIRLWKTWKKGYFASQRNGGVTVKPVSGRTTKIEGSNGVETLDGQDNRQHLASLNGSAIDTSPDISPEPAWITLFERTIGFITTWVWLGYTARWFVLAFTRAGVFWRSEGQPLVPSLFGGLIWGKWMH